jgi:essential nuclear protein 1
MEILNSPSNSFAAQQSHELDHHSCIPFKMPKVTTPVDARKRRHNPLEQDVLATGPLTSKAPKKKARKDGDDEHFVDAKASRQILQISHALAEEERDEFSRSDATGEPAQPVFFPLDRVGGHDDDDDDDERIGDDGDPGGNDDAWASEEEMEEVEADPEDLEAWRKFFPQDDEDQLLREGWPGAKGSGPSAEGESINLSELILQKIAEHEAAGNAPDEPDDGEVEIDPRVFEMYRKVGQHLAHYRSGPLVNKPIEFMLSAPSPLWEEFLLATEPEKWTPHATYAMTKKFVSRKNPVMEKYNEMVLLDKVRTDIMEHGKLNTHLFEAVQKALFKPKAWLVGFLFPLVESGTFTLKEANIVAAVLKRNRLNYLYCALALKKLCDVAVEEASMGTEGGGAVNVLLHTLLEKGAALPSKVIDALVERRFFSSPPSPFLAISWVGHCSSYLLIMSRFSKISARGSRLCKGGRRSGVSRRRQRADTCQAARDLAQVPSTIRA